MISLVETFLWTNNFMGKILEEKLENDSQKVCFVPYFRKPFKTKLKLSYHN